MVDGSTKVGFIGSSTIHDPPQKRAYRSGTAPELHRTFPDHSAAPRQRGPVILRYEIVRCAAAHRVQPASGQPEVLSGSRCGPGFPPATARKAGEEVTARRVKRFL